MKTGSEKLEELEKTGKYVFHGSADGGINVLEPRQATHIPDLSKPQEIINDGEPAVSATPYADFAIYRALVNKNNIRVLSGFGFRDGKKEFRISSREDFETLKDKSGYVYVFNKSDFEPYSRNGKANPNGMEWRSYKDVSPVEIVKVIYDDLKQIEPLIQFTSIQ